MREIVRRAEHPHPVEAQIPLSGIVVQQADRGVAERRRALHLLDHELAGVARADDDRLLAARDEPPGQRPLDQRAGKQARARDERQAEKQVDEPDAARDRCAVDVEGVKTRKTAIDASTTPRKAPHMSRVET